jgi:ABC-type glycerol-3-phosphate transport system substrate-binding protein
MISTQAVLRTTLASAALALLAACGGSESATADSAAAAASPDSAGLQTTPPQPQGPMNMVDSGTKAPTTGDTARRDSMPADTTKRP